MQLVADRFVVLDREGGCAFDLATGERVVLLVSSAGGPSDQRRWVERCSAFRALHHPSIARLVDFGLVGEVSRFEAWACGAAWSGASAIASSTCSDVSAFLSAVGLTPGALAPGSVRTSADGDALSLPEAGTGYPHTPEEDAATMPLRARALNFIDRPGLTALEEIFDAVGSRPHVASLWGPRASGRRTAVGEIARAARLRGFVPIAARLVE